MKRSLKEKAINLRKQGKTYSEILREIPVAKSTLSLWLRSVSLSRKQEQRLTKKKLAAALRGSQARRAKRLKDTRVIIKDAIHEVSQIKIDREKLLLMGSMLYWAEGDKEKTYGPGVRLGFSNSDPYMIKIFLRWAEQCLKISKDRVTFRIYLHENNQYRTNEVRHYWAEHTGFLIDKFGKIAYKHHKIGSLRKNVGDNYFGLLKVQITQSTNINRRVTGWIQGIVEQCGIV